MSVHANKAKDITKILYPTGPADEPEVVFNNEKEEAEYWDKKDLSPMFCAKINIDQEKVEIALAADNQLDLPPEARIKEQQLKLKESLPANSPLLNPFVNETGIANFGSGSISGWNVQDLKGNVSAAEEYLDSNKKTKSAIASTAQGEQLPLLRYINLGDVSIELRYHQDKSNLISAYKVTQNAGQQFELLAEKMTADNLLRAISGRALFISQPKKVSNLKQLEDTATISDE